jgi:DNA invertase Pin-like site-specific DNA recombinase
MNILYIRTSTLDQNSARQSVLSKNFDLTVEDKCSGAIPFFDRNGGQRIKKLVQENEASLTVHEIDRLGRNLLDILSTISYFNEKKVSINFIQQGLQTLSQDGKENPISNMMIGILATVAEMERNQIRERQLEGIAIAKAMGVYRGRKKGTKENPIKFLTKTKNKKAVELLGKGYKNVEIAKITGLHQNTVTKIKKLSKLLNRT